MSPSSRGQSVQPEARSLGSGGEERIKVWRAAPAEGLVAPGTAILAGGNVYLGVADGTVELLEVQPEGKPAMSAAAWMNGRRGCQRSSHGRELRCFYPAGGPSPGLLRNVGPLPHGGRGRGRVSVR